MSLIERAAGLFDEIVVAVAANTGKTPCFTHEERFEMVTQSVDGIKGVRVDSFTNLLADYAQEIGATAIIRGLRALSDFEYEFQMTLMNRKLARDIETVFLMPALSWVYLSSTIVKEVARHGGDISTLVPKPVAKMLRKKFKR
jgi:pantetheine-phosphate adenylyltransferase